MTRPFFPDTVKNVRTGLLNRERELGVGGQHSVSKRSVAEWLPLQVQQGKPRGRYSRRGQVRLGVLELGRTGRLQAHITGTRKEQETKPGEATSRQPRLSTPKCECEHSQPAAEHTA